MGLLVFFIGLFLIVGGAQSAGLVGKLLSFAEHWNLHRSGVFTVAVSFLSNVVSNVPAVLLLRSWAAQLIPPERAWLTLAMASTLAGNLTLVGSVANLIVVEQAGTRHRVGFWAYARVGVPVTLATLAFGYAWLPLMVPAR